MRLYVTNFFFLFIVAINPNQSIVYFKAIIASSVRGMSQMNYMYLLKQFKNHTDEAQCESINLRNALAQSKETILELSKQRSMIETNLLTKNKYIELADIQMMQLKQQVAEQIRSITDLTHTCRDNKRLQSVLEERDSTIAQLKNDVLTAESSRYPPASRPNAIDKFVRSQKMVNVDVNIAEMRLKLAEMKISDLKVENQRLQQFNQKLGMELAESRKNKHKLHQSAKGSGGSKSINPSKKTKLSPSEDADLHRHHPHTACNLKKLIRSELEQIIDPQTETETDEKSIKQPKYTPSTLALLSDLDECTIQGILNNNESMTELTVEKKDEDKTSTTNVMRPIKIESTSIMVAESLLTTKKSLDNIKLKYIFTHPNKFTAHQEEIVEKKDSNILTKWRTPLELLINSDKSTTVGIRINEPAAKITVATATKNVPPKEQSKTDDNDLVIKNEVLDNNVDNCADVVDDVVKNVIEPLLAANAVSPIIKKHYSLRAQLHAPTSDPIIEITRVRHKVKASKSKVAVLMPKRDRTTTTPSSPPKMVKKTKKTTPPRSQSNSERMKETLLSTIDLNPVDKQNPESDTLLSVHTNLPSSKLSKLGKTLKDRISALKQIKC